jgi:hypothetical protein
MNIEIFHIKFINIFMIYFHTKFHMPSFNGSSVITMKLKAKYRFCSAAMLFYIMQKKLPYLKRQNIKSLHYMEIVLSPLQKIAQPQCT